MREEATPAASSALAAAAGSRAAAEARALQDRPSLGVSDTTTAAHHSACAAPSVANTHVCRNTLRSCSGATSVGFCGAQGVGHEVQTMRRTKAGEAAALACTQRAHLLGANHDRPADAQSCKRDETRVPNAQHHHTDQGNAGEGLQSAGCSPRTGARAAVRPKPRGCIRVRCCILTIADEKLRRIGGGPQVVLRLTGLLRRRNSASTKGCAQDGVPEGTVWLV